MSRLLALALTTLSLSGCALGWDCGTVNSTVAKGILRDGVDAPLATVEANLAEDVPSRFRLSVGVMGSGGSAGAPLKGHVTRGRFLTESGELIAEIPTGTSTLYVDVVVALNIELPSRDEYSRVRTALNSGRTKVILETDLPGRELVETTLTDVRDESGVVQRCSPA